MKFLVLWHFDLTRLGPEVIRTVMQMPDYAKKLGDSWSAAITSSAVTVELGFTRSHRTKNLIGAMSPVYNYACYQVLALAEMEDPTTITGKAS